MQGFGTMLKLNLKLLLRNKGYLASVILIPLLSLFWIWALESSADYTPGVKQETNIAEIGVNDNALHGDDKLDLAVKVYDASHSKTSEYFITTLADFSMYSLYRADATGLSEEEVKESATYTAEHSNLFTSIYIPEDFESKLLAGQTDQAVTLYLTSEDERAKMLTINSQMLLKNIGGYAASIGNDSEALHKIIAELTESEIKKEVKTVSTGELTVLTDEQRAQKYQFGYVLAFFCLSFLLSGVFISSIYVAEKNNNVLKRVTLTKANFINYISVKIVLAVITLVAEEIIVGIGIQMVGNTLGVSTLPFVAISSGVGLVLILLSIAVGTYTDNVVTVAFSGFFIWTISNCLSGLYFPISNSSVWIQALSKLMPQYWSIKLYDMMLTGDGASGTIMYIAVTLGFVVLIGCLGVLGLKLKSKK